MDDNKSPKLFLNMIVADYEQEDVLKRILDDITPYVNGIYIDITYRNKKPSQKHPLVKLIKSYDSETTPVSLDYFKWVKDFAKARNHVLDRTPKGSNSYMTWYDTDDRIMHPELIPEIFRSMILKNIVAIYIPYWYQVDLDDQGDVREILTEQKRERIILNNGSIKWIGALHETLIDQGTENRNKVLLQKPIVVHLTDNDRMSANIDRNLEILIETHKKEDGKDPRTTMYLAKTYYDMAKSQYNINKEKFQHFAVKAVQYFNEYLSGVGTPGEKGYRPPSGWAEERSTAWSYLAEISLLTGDLESAEAAYQHAIDESEKFPNYYVDLAHVYINMGKWDKAKHYLTIGTNMPEKKTTIITNPRDNKLRALEATAKIAMHEEDFVVAKSAVEQMLVLTPENKDLEEKLTTLKSLIVFNKACQSAVYLGKYLEQIGEPEKIAHLTKSFSNDMQQERFAAEMRSMFNPPRTWAQNEITIFAGPCFEEWTPESLKTGLGGSEEAIVYMSRELAKLGWKVTVYANPGHLAGEFDGVDYKMWYDFNQNDFFNILILWRGISFVDANPKAKFLALWAHDVPNAVEYTKERVEKLDRIIVLSEYHKSLFLMNDNGEMKNIPEGKFWLSANGISEMNPKGKRVNKSMIYGSSPDRGLIYLLNNWKKIKDAVPEATLNIYYGFVTFDAMFKNNPERQAWKSKMLKLMEQDGITYHGRVGHEELHDASAKTDVWVYPTDFAEISCITAQKNQALGAIPFVTDYAALSETVKTGVRVDVDITDEKGQEEFFNELIKFLNDDEKREKLRKPMMVFAQEYFLWRKVAEDWSAVFKNELGE